MRQWNQHDLNKNGKRWKLYENGEVGYEKKKRPRCDFLVSLLLCKFLRFEFNRIKFLTQFEPIGNNWREEEWIPGHARTVEGGIWRRRSPQKLLLLWASNIYVKLEIVIEWEEKWKMKKQKIKKWEYLAKNFLDIDFYLLLLNKWYV